MSELRYRILVVDDEESMRDVLAILLQREGYEVVTAGSGVEALRQMEERPADVVLTDITMPRMDGIQLLKGIKGLQSAAQTLINEAARVAQPRGERTHGCRRLTGFARDVIEGCG